MDGRQAAGRQAGRLERLERLDCQSARQYNHSTPTRYAREDGRAEGRGARELINLSSYNEYDALHEADGVGGWCGGSAL